VECEGPDVRVVCLGERRARGDLRGGGAECVRAWGGAVCCCWGGGDSGGGGCGGGRWEEGSERACCWGGEVPVQDGTF
jgi:hypothetical protein